MKIEFEGRTWEVETGDLTVQQAMVITSYLGTSLNGWQTAMTDPESPHWLKAIQCLYWLMLAQDGQNVPVADTDFALVKFADAFADAALAANPPAGQDAEPDPTNFAGVNGAAAAAPATPVTTG
jgi:hypothetical protein